jgi:hypothetical protein
VHKLLDLTHAELMKASLHATRLLHAPVLARWLSPSAAVRGGGRASRDRSGSAASDVASVLTGMCFGVSFLFCMCVASARPRPPPLRPRFDQQGRRQAAQASSCGQEGCPGEREARDHQDPPPQHRTIDIHRHMGTKFACLAFQSSRLTLARAAVETGRRGRCAAAQECPPRP